MNAHARLFKMMLPVALVAAITACNRAAPPEQTEQAQTQSSESAAPDMTSTPPPDSALASNSPAMPPAPAVPADTPPFADKVWKVKASSAVSVDTTYSFLSDGTLVIDDHQGKPGYGKWTYTNGALTMIEEGQSYPTDILKLDDSVFEIRSNNPGEPVTITLVPAEGMPLPPAPAG
ncbi:MAG: hypothetical protein ABJA62_04985 [Luteimonas sp.]